MFINQCYDPLRPCRQQWGRRAKVDLLITHTWENQWTPVGLSQALSLSIQTSNPLDTLFLRYILYGLNKYALFL